MLIIDSLLNFKFFSLERCGEPLSFCYHAHDVRYGEQSLAPS